MSNLNTNIELLAQRLDALENINNKQSEQIESLQREAASLEGAQKQSDRASNNSGKLIAPAISVFVLVASAFIGNFVIDKIDLLEKDVVVLTVSAADREARVKAIGDRQIPSLGDVESALAKIDTRLTGLESSYELMRGVDSTQNSDIAILRASSSANDTRAASMLQRVESTEKGIDGISEMSRIHSKNISSIDAKTSAGFVEIESQLRGIQAMFIGALDASDRIVGTIWQK
jgi:hypothetical protein